MTDDIQKLIEKLELLPHPEGGFYRETYRSDGVIAQPTGFDEERNFSTAIYFLLVEGNFSAFHRIKADEVWHFYSGSTTLVHVIDQSGEYTCHRLGSKIGAGEVPQLVVNAGDWFGSSVIDGGNYSLVGCTVAPGFDFRDFEMAKRDDLLKAYPQHSFIISQLTRE